MLKNYFTVAWRHLMQHKLFSLITVSCLVIGLTSSLIIGVYILQRERVNDGLRHVSNQYLIKSKWKVPGMGMDITTVAPLAKTIKEEYPNLVANYYRYNPVTTTIRAGDNSIMADVAIGDTTLAVMYGFQVLHGDAKNLQPTPSSAAITETMARKLFGSADVVGRTFGMQTTSTGNFQQYAVSAVLKDIPENSVLGLVGKDAYQVFVPTVGNQYYAGGDPSVSWRGTYEVGFIELQPGVRPADMEKPFKQVLAKYTKDPVTSNLTVQLEPVQHYNLTENSGAGQRMITTLGFVGGFILLMAIINFVNISIGTSSYRLKEIGLRKVFGGARRQLVGQFLVEALSLAVLAGLISLLCYQLLLPLSNNALQTSLTSVSGFSWMEFGGLLSLVLLVGLLAGWYPALVLSALNVVNSVKGKLDSAKGGMMLRKGLLVVQFSLAILVFISALNVSRQVHYIFSKDLGYHKEQLLVVRALPKQWDSVGVQRMEDIRKGLERVPAVQSAALSFEIPERTPPGSLDLLPVNGGHRISPAMLGADDEYAGTYGMVMKEGAFFGKAGEVHQPGQIVLNESAEKALGLQPGKAVGTRVYMPPPVGGGGTASGNAAPPSFVVAGVVKDFNYSNLQQVIQPLVFLNVKDTRAYRWVTVKLRSSDMTSAVEAVRAQWKAMSPTAPFEYFFMDDKFQSLYQSELQLKNAAGIATGLNLLIVLLGIFGMVAFTLARRRKEMAIRKVLGAELLNIVWLFLKEYAGLIVLANAIAWPLAWQATDRWLENYAYRVKLDWGPFVVAAGVVLALTAVLVGVMCVRTANGNPADKLRVE